MNVPQKPLCTYSETVGCTHGTHGPIQVAEGSSVVYVVLSLIIVAVAIVYKKLGGEFGQ